MVFMTDEEIVLYRKTRSPDRTPEQNDRYVREQLRRAREKLLSPERPDLVPA